MAALLPNGTVTCVPTCVPTLGGAAGMWLPSYHPTRRGRRSWRRGYPAAAPRGGEALCSRQARSLAGEALPSYH